MLQTPHKTLEGIVDNTGRHPPKSTWQGLELYQQAKARTCGLTRISATPGPRAQRCSASRRHILAPAATSESGSNKTVTISTARPHSPRMTSPSFQHALQMLNG
eukprot:150877-Amphidinium_carterae.1